MSRGKTGTCRWSFAPKAWSSWRKEHRKNTGLRCARIATRQQQSSSQETIGPLEPISLNNEQTIELDQDPDQLHVEHHHQSPNNSPQQYIRTETIGGGPFVSSKIPDSEKQLGERSKSRCVKEKGSPSGAITEPSVPPQALPRDRCPEWSCRPAAADHSTAADQPHPVEV